MSKKHVGVIMDDKIYNNANVKSNFELFNNEVQKQSDVATNHSLKNMLEAFRMTLECFVSKTQDK
jgi:hypothetical protein